MTVVYGSKSILLLSASFMFWLGGTDQFQSDSVWYWISTEQAINNGYTDWHATEPDHPGDTSLRSLPFRFSEPDLLLVFFF